jgi:hypothetical protein
VTALQQLSELLRENPGAFAQASLQILLHLVTAVALIALYRRAGYGRAWAVLALSPVVATPLALWAILVGYATPEEAQWLLMPFLAAAPAMLVKLALGRSGTNPTS